MVTLVENDKLNSNPLRQLYLSIWSYLYIYIIAEAERKWVPTIKDVLSNNIILKNIVRCTVLGESYKNPTR